MNKLYLIAIPGHLDLDQVIKSLQERGAISFWFYYLPYSFFARSMLSAKQLQEAMDAQFGINRIFIIRITNTSDFSGRVPDNQLPLFDNL